MKMSKIESAIRVVLEFNKAFNQHDVAAMTALMSDDCTFENYQPTPDGAVYSGKETISRFLQDFFRASPQAHLEIEEVFGLGMRCVVRWRYNWVDEAGSKRYVRGVDIFQVRGGYIYERLSYVKG